jgi:hypothetical protein
LSELKDNSFIITTYHTGSYRLVISLLLRLEIKIVIVTEQRFIEKQSKEVFDLKQKLCEYLHIKSTDNLEILSAQDASLFLKLRRKLEDGYSIVFYVDGNTGMFEYDVNDSKLMKINFLSDYINVRKGIAFLSYLTKTKIISFISKRDSNLDNEITIDSINTDFSLSRNEFIELVTKNLYTKLELFLLKNPQQWEGWFYVNEFTNSSKIPQPSSPKIKMLVRELIGKKLIFNEKDFKLYGIQESFFVINYKSFEIIEVSKFIYNLLLFFMSKREINENYFTFEGVRISRKIIKELFNFNYLTYA